MESRKLNFRQGRKQNKGDSKTNKQKETEKDTI